MVSREGNVTIEGARLFQKNFSGHEGKYNREGERTFAVLLDDEIARPMFDDGWNVKWMEPRTNDEEPQAVIHVACRFDILPPRIVMISSRGRTPIREDEVELLDWADLRTVDLILRPRRWDVGGKSGVKAYLKSMFVTIEEDELDLKYADVPER